MLKDLNLRNEDNARFLIKNDIIFDTERNREYNLTNGEDYKYLTTLLNRQDSMIRLLRIDRNNTHEVLSDFMNMLNRLQSNPNDESLKNQARDMLIMMDVDLK